MEQQSVSDAKPAASSAASAAPTPLSGQAALDAMSPEQLATWERTGDLPSTTPSADSSPAKPAEQAAGTPASPTESAASEPAKPADAGKDKGAKARSAELDTEITELRDKLRIRAALREELGREQPRQDARQPESSAGTPPTKAEWQRYMEMPNAPREEDFERFGDFTAAMGLFITDQRWQEHQSRAQHQTAIERQVQSVEQLGQTARERIEAATKDDPDFAKKVDDGLLAIEPASVVRLKGGKVGPANVLAEEILKSEHTGKLLLHFSSEEGRRDGARLVQMSYPELMRAFGRLEARFESTGTPAADTRPTPKDLSTAPAPGTELGKRPQEPLDPTQAALQRKDYAAYEAAENARFVGAR